MLSCTLSMMLSTERQCYSEDPIDGKYHSEFEFHVRVFLSQSQNTMISYSTFPTGDDKNDNLGHIMII